jgi:hypothetical protein
MPGAKREGLNITAVISDKPGMQVVNLLDKASVEQQQRISRQTMKSAFDFSGLARHWSLVTGHF